MNLRTASGASGAFGKHPLPELSGTKEPAAKKARSEAGATGIVSQVFGAVCGSEQAMETEAASGMSGQVSSMNAIYSLPTVLADGGRTKTSDEKLVDASHSLSGFMKRDASEPCLEREAAELCLKNVEQAIERLKDSCTACFSEEDEETDCEKLHSELAGLAEDYNDSEAEIYLESQFHVVFTRMMRLAECADLLENRDIPLEIKKKALVALCTDITSSSGRLTANVDEAYGLLKVFSGDRCEAVLFDARKDLVDREVQQLIDCMRFVAPGLFDEEDIPQYKANLYNRVAERAGLFQIKDQLSEAGYYLSGRYSLLYGENHVVEAMLCFFEKEILSLVSPTEILNYICEKCCAKIEAAREEKVPGAGKSVFTDNVNAALKPIAALLGRDVMASEVLGENTTNFQIDQIRKKTKALLSDVAKDRFGLDYGSLEDSYALSVGSGFTKLEWSYDGGFSVIEEAAGQSSKHPLDAAFLINNPGISLTFAQKRDILRQLVKAGEVSEFALALLFRQDYSFSEIVFISCLHKQNAEEIINYLSGRRVFPDDDKDNIPFADIISFCSPSEAASLFVLLPQQGWLRGENLREAFSRGMSQWDVDAVLSFLAADEAGCSPEMEKFLDSLLQVYDCKRVVPLYKQIKEQNSDLPENMKSYINQKDFMKEIGKRKLEDVEHIVRNQGLSPEDKKRLMVVLTTRHNGV